MRRSRRGVVGESIGGDAARSPRRGHSGLRDLGERIPDYDEADPEGFESLSKVVFATLEDTDTETDILKDILKGIAPVAPRPEESREKETSAGE